MQTPSNIGKPAGTCGRCKGTGQLSVKTAGGIEKRRCPSCGGSGGANTYRTK